MTAKQDKDIGKNIDEEECNSPDPTESSSDTIRFSISFPTDHPDTEPAPSIKLSMEEIERIENEIRERVELLRQGGVDELIIQSLFDKDHRLSRITITDDYRIMLTDYQIEIQFAPLTKAIYLLFLRHPEGIRFKELAEYEEELFILYHRITKRLDMVKQRSTVKGVVMPFSNDINIHVSRIKQAFMAQFCDELAAYYIIDGESGETKTIKIPREFVSWEG